MSRLLRWKPMLLGGSSNTLDVARSFFELGKPRLTALVLGTTMAGYSLGAVHFDGTLLGATLLGTALSSTSAHALNQWAEAPYDAQMLRTRQRPIPAAKLLAPQAALFGLAAGAAGVGILGTFCNGASAGLALSTIILYAAVYTPMKRWSPRNTWVGSLVGAIPPAIGFVAATSNASLWSLEALTLPGILFAWQFPHFCALSWKLRADYAFGGYRMMSVESPAKNARTALFYSLMLPAICAGISFIGQTNWYFMASSSLFNIPLIAAAAMFHKNPTRKSARRLFLLSLVHLPLLMLSMLYHHQRNQKNRAGSAEKLIAQSYSFTASLINE